MPSCSGADLDALLHDLVIGRHDEHIAAGLVARHHAVGHHQSRPGLGQRHAQPREQAGQEDALGIGEHRAQLQRAAAGVESRAGEVERPLVRVTRSGLQPDVYRDLRGGAGDVARPRFRARRGYAARRVR